MEKTDLKVNDIVQINPRCGTMFGGSLMIVTEPKSWGAQGYIHGLGEGYICGLGQGLAYCRYKFEDMELVGHAIWNQNDNP